jgi:Protein of unknown function (DUF1579)
MRIPKKLFMRTRPSLSQAVVLLLALLSPAALTAAPVAAHDPFLAQLAGDWQLTGTVRGKAVRYRGTGAWLLEGGWLCLALTDQAQPPAYQARVYLGFDPKADDYIAHWLDQFGAAGARIVGSGRRHGQTLVLGFPYADGAFRDTLTLAADGNSGSLLIESAARDGHWSTFASYQLVRLRATPAAAP